jgi:mono/diheme cytochrome c family protein
MNPRIAALLLLLVPGCAIGLIVADGGPTGEPQNVTADASRGKPIYLRDCAPCHGETGEGNGPLAGKFDPPPTNLVAWGVRVSVKDLEVIFQTPHYSTHVMTERVTGGKHEMPAWDEVLTQQEIDDVIAYVRSLIQAHPHAEETRG